MLRTHLHRLLLSLSLIGAMLGMAVQAAPDNQQQLEADRLAAQQHYIAAEQQQLTQLQGHPETSTADLWRAVRAGDTGYTPAQTFEAGRLINAFGEEGRVFHNTYSVPILGFALVGVFGLFLVFYFINGPARLTKGFSGKMVLRWTQTDRVLHWIMAISCLLMMLTGIVIMLGRHVFEDLLSPSVWAALIYGSKTVHDWTGPVFIVAWVLSILKWMPKQTFKMYDLRWFTTAGGYVHFGPFKGKHPDSGFANAGEKLWFWTLAIFGLFISITGVILVLPELTITRESSMLALLIHGLSAAVLIAFTIVHIWMATVLSEGGLESMVSGYCDENWAIQHHNLWYDEIKENGTLQYK